MTKPSPADELCRRLFDAARGGDQQDTTNLVVRASSEGIEVRAWGMRSDFHETLTDALRDVHAKYVAAVSVAISRNLEHVAEQRKQLDRLGVVP